ncbi:hypothetical protein [Phaeobacter inhibens]|uniref:hypothetical protein n=1 Tax=Phaeobacter inhibens TaxID=221822 RepID=UPI000971BAC2|nr:hypothetical protein [Phaeobacter inhibens]APX14999.1 hypothetical protein BWR17_03455 [Phaeobacter inhibens]AUR08097.1 hypothetical protein PhaeoP59_01926 [Phaeobacter inhibens]
MWVFVCLLTLGAFAWALQRYTKAKIRANNNMISALDDMFDKWGVLMDAKDKYESDVPDSIMALATWMVKTAQNRGMEWHLASSLMEDRASNGSAPSASLREPLDEVFRDLTHAWFMYQANRNLLARLIIRSALGRMIEKDDHFSPYDAKLVNKVAETKGGLGCMMAA